METSNTIEHLRATLLAQINSQESARKLFRKILNRITIIYIIVSAAILGGVILIIFILNRPKSEIHKAMNEVNNLNSRITIQRIELEELKRAQDSISQQLKIK